MAMVAGREWSEVERKRGVVGTEVVCVGRGVRAEMVTGPRAGGCECGVGGHRDVVGRWWRGVVVVGRSEREAAGERGLVGGEGGGGV